MTGKATSALEANRTSPERPGFAAWTDEQLLRQFFSGRAETAEAAFAAIVDRHGGIVQRVCLDVLRGPEEARDAAQAVFLVLAARGRSIRKPEALGPWLHGVALRVARRALGDNLRRKEAERRKAEIMQERQADATEPDLSGLAEIHDEVDRLPESYRMPIILCYMQGFTQAEAAETLGWPLGTVQIRLHRGRQKLRTRLTRRGIGPIGLAGAALTALLALSSPAPGKEWTERTSRAAVRFASGRGTGGLVGPDVTDLVEATLSAMVFPGGKLVAALLAILIFLGSTATLIQRGKSATASTGGVSRTLAIVSSRPKTNNVKVALTRVKETPTPQVSASLEKSVEAEDAMEDVEPPPITLRQSPGLALAIPAPEIVEANGPELFERVWRKDDPRGHGGDGLGPVFNGTSCVACHHKGGTGGAGGVDRNIEIATVGEPGSTGSGFFYSFRMDFGAGGFEYRMGDASSLSSSSTNARNRPRIDPQILAAIHPGFRESRSVILHRFGTDPAYGSWRNTISGAHGTVVVRTSERNPPALFGSGLIDAIPDEAIEQAARRKGSGSASLKGRPGRLKDGRIGRFGWKAQTATLKEFVLSAAAGEMGLEVPGRRQAADPRLPGFEAPGLDMDQADCEALTDYVRGLPTPVVNVTDQETTSIKAGEETFKAIGCAHCHLPKLGDVEGIYSDLLLHDMSPRLGDSDAYTVFNGSEVPDRPAVTSTTAATAREWRTPPLWGLRDSAPYLHDGRAATVDEAIALHAGQGTASAKRYADLSVRRKRHLTAFLNALAAPAETR